jgi:hypothetical protein
MQQDRFQGMAAGARMTDGQWSSGDQPLLCDGAGDPVEAGALIWSSAASAWPGFRLETRRFADDVRICNVTQACSVVALCASGVARLVIRDQRSTMHFMSTPRTLFLNCRGYEYASITSSGSTDWLIVQLDITQLAFLGTCHRGISFSFATTTWRR